MPDPVRLLGTLEKARRCFVEMPGRRGRVVYLDGVEEVMVVGDLHGHLGHFARVLKLADLGGHPGRHLVLQEVTHGRHRYEDGSDKSHQLVDLVAALKCQFPGRVHLLMGNHEMAQWQNRWIGKGKEMSCNELFRAGVESAYGEYGERIYQRYLELFAVLPLAVRTSNRVFVSHSLPRTSLLETFDLPAMSPNCDKRRPSTGAPQSLLMMNSDLLVDFSRHMAGRLQRLSPDQPKRQIETAWRLVYSRSPKPKELAAAQRFLADQAGIFSARRDDATKDHSADRSASEAATALMCQMLLSSNEFLYID